MLKMLLIRFGWVVFERSQKVSINGKKIKNLNFPRFITFCVSKLGVTAYRIELSTTLSLH